MVLHNKAEKIQNILESLNQPMTRTSYFKKIYQLDQLYENNQENEAYDIEIDAETVQKLLKYKPDCQSKKYTPTESESYWSILTRKTVTTEVRTMQDVINLAIRVVNKKRYRNAASIVDDFQLAYHVFKTDPIYLDEIYLRDVLAFAIMMKVLGNGIKKEFERMDCYTRFGFENPKCRDLELFKTISIDIDCAGIVNKKLLGMAYSILAGLKTVKYKYLRIYIDLSSQVYNIGDMFIDYYRSNAKIAKNLFGQFGLHDEIDFSNVNSNNLRMAAELRRKKNNYEQGAAIYAQTYGNSASSP